MDLRAARCFIENTFYREHILAMDLAFTSSKARRELCFSCN